MTPFPARPLSLLTLALALASPALAQSAYLPTPGENFVTSLLSYQRARDFYALGRTQFTLPDPLEQRTARVDFDHGLSPGWALDASVGWSTVTYKESAESFGTPLLKDGKKRQSGLIDTRLGARHTLVDEFAQLSEWTPTLAVRAGVIIPGTYDTGFINAPGDGAAGVELGVLAAKTAVTTGTTFFSDLTWRGYAENVPDALEASFGVSQSLEVAVLTLGIRHLHSLDGVDILGPGFTSIASFSDVKEVNTTLEVGLSVPLGPVTAALGSAWTIAGENTPKKRVFALSATMKF